MRLAAALAVLATAGIAGCAGGAKPPLYSAIETTGSFGYFEEDLGERRVRVGYRAPIRRSHDFSRAEREREGDRLVTLAYDLALLRAAEVAAARGAPSFDVSERENNVDATVSTAYGPDPFLTPWPYWHRRYDPFPFYGAPYGYYADRSSELAVSVTFVAELRAGSDGSFDTGETLGRLQARYPAGRTETAVR